MRRSRLSVGIVLALVLSVMLAACSRPQRPEGSGANTLSIGATASPNGLDMVTVSGAAVPYALLYNVYETLVKLDGEARLKPLLASDWTLSQDRKTYTFTIDAAARFASGEKVTADAVIKSFERNRGAGATEQIRAAWAPVAGLQAKNDRTVVVKLARPSHTWLFELAGPAGIVADPSGLDEIKTTPAGSGPYRFDSWEQGDHLTLKANDRYWGTPARFREVVFRYYAEPNAMNTAMLSGQLDIISNLTVPQSLGQFKDPSRFSVHEGTTNGEVVLGFNHRDKALSNLKVRQAINYAIDRKGLLEAVWGGKGKLIGSMVPPTDPWYEDLSTTYAYNPDRARQLLREAGHQSGLMLRLRVPNLPYAPSSAKYISAQLKQVGITVKTEDVEFPGRWLDEVYTKHDYDMTVIAHVEPRDLSSFAQPGYYWGYDNAQVRRLIDEADTGTEEQQLAKLRQAAKLLAHDAAANWLFLLPNIVVATPRISGLQANQVNWSFDLTTLAAKG